MAKALYVHIPFCAGFCPYCDFPKVYAHQDRIDAYLFSLFQEASSLEQDSYDTIYFGGGTPSVLSPSQLESLLAYFAPKLAIDGEFSIEANPDSLSEEKIAMLARYGVNRVSIGAQSSHEHHLSRLGRHHDFETVKAVVDTLIKYGITNINLDLMIALPGETIDEVNADVMAFLALPITHLSAYTLIVEENTKYGFLGVQETDADIQAEHILAVQKAASEAGFIHYEVSNYAKPGYMCRHNLAYWHDEDFDAVGLGASGHRGKLRYKNTVDFPKYLKQEHVREEEYLSKQEEKECFLLCNLRLSEGFAFATYKTRFGEDIRDEKGTEIESLIQRGLLNKDNTRLFPTIEGMMLLDQVLVELF